MNWESIVNLGICRSAAKDASKFSNERCLDLTMEPFIGGALSINVYREGGSRRRLRDLGNGVQNYIISKILYEITQPEILLWDDVEAHFNPRILLDLSIWFLDLIERGRQVVLTTHSLEAAEIIARQSEDKAKIYLASIIDGKLRVRQITLDEIEELRRAGIDVRTAETLLI
jgi:predicted ATPase